MAEKQFTFAFAQIKSSEPEVTRSYLGAGNPNWKGGGAVLTCGYCQKPFPVSHARKTIAKFCSLSCWSRDTNRVHSRNGKPTGKRVIRPDVTKKCEWCQKEFTASHIQRNKKFCTKGCEFVWRRSWMEANGNPNWLGGISRQPYPFNWPLISRKIRKRDGRACLNPKCDKASKHITVHHIDYNKSNCDPANLISLCNACNSRVNYGREKWQEFFNRLQESRGILPLVPGSPCPYVPDVPGRKGSTHPLARLTEDDIREIRRMKQAGMRNRRIAEHFQMTESSICNILKGKTWKHVV